MPKGPSQKHPAHAFPPGSLSQGTQPATLPTSLKTHPNSFLAKPCADWPFLTPSSSPASVLSMHSITATLGFPQMLQVCSFLRVFAFPSAQNRIVPQDSAWSSSFSFRPFLTILPKESVLLTHLSPFLASLHSCSQANILLHIYLFLIFLLLEWKAYEVSIMYCSRLVPEKEQALKKYFWMDGWMNQWMNTRMTPNWPDPLTQKSWDKNVHLFCSLLLNLHI